MTGGHPAVRGVFREQVVAAVYAAMLPSQLLLCLLADAPAMSWMLIKELIVCGDVRRCFLVCPSSPLATALEV